MIEAYRCTQPVARLEQALRHTRKHPRYGKGHYLVEHALFMRRHYAWEVRHFDQTVADPRLKLDVYCYSCHGMRGEHAPTCRYSPRGRAYIAWLRHRLAATEVRDVA